MMTSGEGLCWVGLGWNRGGRAGGAPLGRFKRCAVDVLSVDEAQIVPEATFESLDADSLDLVELVMALEEEFDVNVEEEELEGVNTIQAAFDLVSSKL